MRITMPHPLAGKGSVDLIGTPIRLSETPPSYRLHPPSLGENTDEVLEDVLRIDGAARAELRKAGII
jgi:crotonobetainyl-CoA:carnitine CoA-transferase CaiB-like acyl-CoA transferase